MPGFGAIGQFAIGQVSAAIVSSATVTLTLGASEINQDQALIALQVFDSTASSTGAAGANVSIIEIEAVSGAAMSIRE